MSEGRGLDNPLAFATVAMYCVDRWYWLGSELSGLPIGVHRVSSENDTEIGRQFLRLRQCPVEFQQDVYQFPSATGIPQRVVIEAVPDDVREGTSEQDRAAVAELAHGLENAI